MTRRELLAVVEGIKHFHHYLYGQHFSVRTDHGALNWLMQFKNPEGQMARWLEVLSVYDFSISHRPGKSHGNADGLSRRPCGECQYFVCQFICKFGVPRQVHTDQGTQFESVRSSVHDSTGETPSLLMLGREVELPIDMLYGRNDTPKIPSDSYEIQRGSSGVQKIVHHNLLRPYFGKTGTH